MVHAARITLHLCISMPRAPHRRGNLRVGRAMRVRRTPMPLLAFGLVVLLAAGIPPAPAAAQRPGFTRDVLPNGLVVLVEERPASGLVAVEVAVLAGARFEHGSTAGAAQF